MTLSSTRLRHFLGVVDRNAGRLLSVVSDLLFMTQAQVGQLNLEKHSVDQAASSDR